MNGALDWNEVPVEQEHTDLIEANPNENEDDDDSSPTAADERFLGCFRD